MAIPTLLDGDITVNGVRYVLARDVDTDRPGLAWWREAGELVTASWSDWSGGMGEFTCQGATSNGYAFTQKMTCDQGNFIRLAPCQQTLAVAAGSRTIPAYFYQATGSSDTFIYLAHDVFIYKFYIQPGGDNTILEAGRKAFSTGSQMGKPAKFEGLWYIPLGETVVFSEQTTVNARLLTRQFYYNGATYDNNTTEAASVGGTPFTLLSGATDYAYFGITDYQFESLSFDIATAAAGATVSWEYWSGAAWTALTVTDNTTNFTTDGTVYWTAPADWAQNTVNSVSAYWVRAIPSGALGTVPTCKYSWPGDKWTDAGAGLYATAFATVMDGGTAKLLRSYSTNLVALVATAPRTAGNWGSGFEAGDTSTNITSVVDSGVVTGVGKEDNLYVFDTVGTAHSVFNIQPGTKGFYDVRDPKGVSPSGRGTLALPGTEMVAYNNAGSLHLMVGDTVVDASPQGLAAIPNLLCEPFRGNFYETTAIGRYLLALYRLDFIDSGNTYVLLSELREAISPNRRWHSLSYDAKDLRGIHADNESRLWTFDTAGVVRYRQLATDGSSSGGYYSGTLKQEYGNASTQHRIFFPEVPFYRSNGDSTWDRLKTLRACKVLTRDLGATCPLQVQVMRDGAAVQDVGSTITSVGYSERSPTAGTNDTCHLARYVLDITTTADYAPASSDPQILDFEGQATLQEVHFIVDCAATVAQHYVSDAKTIRDNLEKLRGAAGQTVTSPDGSSLTLTITRVSDSQTMMDQNNDISWFLEVVAEVN